MTKLAICLTCSDIVSPHRAWQADRSWRWCHCDHTGVRWRDGTRGLLEVTSLHGPDDVRILGLDNVFLAMAVKMRGITDAGHAEWRDLHRRTCSGVDSHYLFHEGRRGCWALVVAVGESGDVFFVPYGEAKTTEASPAGTPPLPAPPVTA